ncbi:MAG TPA: hypothetical protein VJO35_03090 [Terriglobales bacterium]|nr:hypothetical protein [Terriglobales bacterium]
MARIALTLLFGFFGAATLFAQSGPCTETMIKGGQLPAAADAFAYMPPYGKPEVGKSAVQQADEKSFSDRTNVKSAWADNHRIVSSPSADMAYEYGTLHMSSDSKSKPGAAGHEEFDAVMLIVYKANKGACQQVALTMQPLEKSEH